MDALASRLMGQKMVQNCLLLYARSQRGSSDVGGPLLYDLQFHFQGYLGVCQCVGHG